MSDKATGKTSAVVPQPLTELDDATLETVTGGTGALLGVRVFDGRTGQQVEGFLTFDPTLHGTVKTG
jgi:hypothetical protein